MEQETKNKNDKFTFKNRFRYWFDTKMTKSSLSLIRILIIASILLAVLIAALIILFGFNEEGEIASVFWNGIATVINAWMPSYEDGSPGYVIMMAVIAIGGVLFTSVLIGIITSAIEERIDNLKRGNSLVLEKDHIVVLGFTPGEFTLLNQLVLAAAGKPGCVVVAEDREREEMEEAIADNIDVPKNFRFVCRTVDITDPASIAKCSVETCRTVIISPTDDMKTTKAILAVSALLEEKGVPEISVNAIISKDEYRFPPSLVETNHITALKTNDILARMVAHSCTQTGLSGTFQEVFDFEGSEFYLTDVDGIDGLTFEELAVRLDCAVPAGVYRGGKLKVNPPAGYKLKTGDRILVFSEEASSARLGPAPENAKLLNAVKAKEEKEAGNTVIFGSNESLPLIIAELPENVRKVCLVGQETTPEEKEELRETAAARGISLTYNEEDARDAEVLLEIAGSARHIVILNRRDTDPEEADMEAVFLLLNLRDIRERYGLPFNITVEMQKEQNHKLAGRGDHTDFLVDSSMSSLILAQLAESPELIELFREIFSNKGNELYLKNVGAMKLCGRHSVRDLRRAMLRQGYILLGWLDAKKNSRFDLLLDEELELTEDDDLIVFGEN